ncbi:Uma2 family endonuclease [Phaeodactylibacter sp.]|jgi:Uma2 family endonuclease|uniref:Uma2 family endonuclease n=1 Tax=Phaeodactylibacter sp. TaxID=1940289 RepID=UPI0025F80243|nr:Uma2 family endonuclease [Phaeodactylibacter sp.]MCI4651790.1 Uma2 family endonuclease [Phaeodactylibacter sp.]MCI5090074.1 Uma2 family endonuclease [Phaeodactylibacter sp.]
MPQPEKYLSISDYLAAEEQSSVKQEYHNGLLVDMAGGSIDHNRIAGNMYFELRSRLQDSCTVFNSDQKVYLEVVNHFVYPDVSVVCGELVAQNQAILNPVLIVEVLSDGTSAYDRDAKFRKYRTLPAFREYLLIDQDQPIVDALFRESKDYWRMQTIIGLDREVPVHSLGIRIPMRAIYAGLNNLMEPQIPFNI